MFMQIRKVMIFPEIFFIQYFTSLVVNLMTSSLQIPNLHNTKRQYLQNKKLYSKKENVILLYFEKPFKYAAVIFHAIGTLSGTDA